MCERIDLFGLYPHEAITTVTRFMRNIQQMLNMSLITTDSHRPWYVHIIAHASNSNENVNKTMLKDVVQALLQAKGKFDFDDVVMDYENGSFFVKLWRGESTNIWTVDDQAEPTTND